MGAKDAELATHRRRAPSPFRFRKSVRSWIQQPLQIAVAKAVDGELATMNGLQQSMIVCLERSQRREPTACKPARLFQRTDEFLQMGRIVQGRESIQVAVVEIVSEMSTACRKSVKRLGVIRWWWPTTAERTAKILEKARHHVLFVEARKNA
jgi:hypothetical protein